MRWQERRGPRPLPGDRRPTPHGARGEIVRPFGWRSHARRRPVSSPSLRTSTAKIGGPSGTHRKHAECRTRRRREGPAMGETHHEAHVVRNRLAALRPSRVLAQADDDLARGIPLAIRPSATSARPVRSRARLCRARERGRRAWPPRAHACVLTSATPHMAHRQGEPATHAARPLAPEPRPTMYCPPAAGRSVSGSRSQRSGQFPRFRSNLSWPQPRRAAMLRGRPSARASRGR